MGWITLGTPAIALLAACGTANTAGTVGADDPDAGVAGEISERDHNSLLRGGMIGASGNQGGAMRERLLAAVLAALVTGLLAARMLDIWAR